MRPKAQGMRGEKSRARSATPGRPGGFSAVSNLLELMLRPFMYARRPACVTTHRVSHVPPACGFGKPLITVEPQWHPRPALGPAKLPSLTLMRVLRDKSRRVNI
jgi:hypothetical protein